MKGPRLACRSLLYPRIVGRMVVNPDLTEERSKGTFDVDLMAAFLYGGKDALMKRREIDELVANTPEMNSDKPLYSMTRVELYEEACKRAEAMGRNGLVDKISVRDILGSAEDMNYFIKVAMQCEISPMHLHYVMFQPALQSLASDQQQKKWLPLAVSRQIIGTYAQTELGHGTNIRRLETTATYDPKTEEFVMNSPTLTSAKWWPGNLGHSCNHAVVIAQLNTKGVCHGIHPFIVQIRDMQTHKPLKGVEVGDIGEKLSQNSNDNGYLLMDHVRIPRMNMLMRYYKVEKDGTYHRSGNDKLGYGAMLYVRSVMIRDQAFALAKAATIAVRYSCVRRQGDNGNPEKEMKILDYQTQQYRVIPELAKAFVFFFAGNSVRDLYAQFFAQMQNQDASSLAELHIVSSGLKALVSWEVAQGIEQCRLSCGGHGYMQASGFPALYGMTVAGATYEGDNIVMLLQVARFLLKLARNIQAGDLHKLTPTTKYLGERVGSKHSSFDKDMHIEHLVDDMQHVARRLVFKCFASVQEKVLQGTTLEDAVNGCSVMLCKAARAHIRVYLSRNALAKVVACESLPLRTVLSKVVKFYILHSVTSHAANFIEDGFLNEEQMCLVRSNMLDVMLSVRQEAVCLVDGWSFTDRELCSSLGKYDGNVYESLFQAAKHSQLNQKQVQDAYHKYLRPMMQRKAQSKL